MADEELDDADEPVSSLGGYFTGKVVDHTGNPVPGATVRIIDLDQNADEYLETTTRDDDYVGEFVFEELNDEATRQEYQDQYERPSIFARKDEWFYSIQAEAPTLLDEPQDVELPLYYQILFGPEVAKSQNHPTAVVTVWRELYPDTPTEQTLFVEITNAAMSDRPHVITEDDIDIDNGMFLVTVNNDDIWIDFGTQTDIDLRYGPATIRGIDTVEQHRESNRWHPIQTDLPLISLSALSYPKIQSTDADELETVAEGLGKFLSGIPMLSAVFSWIDAIDFVNDYLGREITLGDATPGVPDPTGDPEAMQEFADPNTHTTALLGWEEPAKASVLLTVPLEFQTETKEAGITVQAEWVNDSIRASPIQVTFGHTDTLTRGDAIEPAGSNENDDPDPSITTQLIDRETGDPIEKGTVLLWPNRMGHGWGPKVTDSNGVVTFENLGEVHSFDSSTDLEVTGLRARAAGYSPADHRDLSWRPSDGLLELTVELEAEDRDVERSILIVNVVDSDYPEIPSVTVEQHVERHDVKDISERINNYGTVRFSLEDGGEYTVTADGVSETQTITLNGDTEITLSGGG